MEEKEDEEKEEGKYEEEKTEEEEEEEEEEEGNALAKIQAIAEIQFQELQQARDRVFQAFIQKEARRVAAMIAAAPPLAISSLDSDVGSSGTIITALTEEEDQEDVEEKEDIKAEEDYKEEEKKEGDRALAKVQATAELQLQELRQARDRVFQAFIQKEARRVAAMIAAAPPLATSSLDSDVGSSGAIITVLTKEEEKKDEEDKEEKDEMEEEEEATAEEKKNEKEEEEDKALAKVQATAELQLQDLRQARDRVFQGFIQKEARGVAALIAAAPPLATLSPDLSDAASSGTNSPELTEEEEEKEKEEKEKEEEKDLEEKVKDTNVEEEEEEKKEEKKREDKALAKVKKIAEVQLQELQQARDRVFQALIQKEARMVAALIAAAPPLFPSPQPALIIDSAPTCGTNLLELEEEKERKKERKEEEKEKEIEEKEEEKNKQKEQEKKNRLTGVQEITLPTAVRSENIGDVGETRQVIQSPPANRSPRETPPAPETRAFIDDIMGKTVSRLSMSTGEQATEAPQPASAQKVNRLFSTCYKCRPYEK